MSFVCQKDYNMFGVGSGSTLSAPMSDYDRAFLELGNIADAIGRGGDTGPSGTVPIKSEGDSLVGAGGKTITRYIADNAKAAGRPLLDADSNHYMKGLKEDIFKDPTQYGDTVEEAVEMYDEVSEMIETEYRPDTPAETAARDAYWIKSRKSMAEEVEITDRFIEIMDGKFEAPEAEIPSTPGYEPQILRGSKRAWYNPKRVFARRAYKKFKGSSENQFRDWVGTEMAELEDSMSESESELTDVEDGEPSYTDTEPPDYGDEPSFEDSRVVEPPDAVADPFKAVGTKVDGSTGDTELTNLGKIGQTLEETDLRDFKWFDKSTWRDRSGTGLTGEFTDPLLGGVELTEFKGPKMFDPDGPKPFADPDATAGGAAHGLRHSERPSPSSWSQSVPV